MGHNQPQREESRGSKVPDAHRMPSTETAGGNFGDGHPARGQLPVKRESSPGTCVLLESAEKLISYGISR